jgi:nitrate/nitrite transporter NarK
VPAQFLTGASAAVGIALINTLGNVGGFAAGYVTGAIKDLTGSYVVPMFVVGGLMVLSGLLMVWLSRRGRIATTGIDSTERDLPSPGSEMATSGPLR